MLGEQRVDSARLEEGLSREVILGRGIHTLTHGCTHRHVHTHTQAQDLEAQNSASVFFKIFSPFLMPSPLLRHGTESRALSTEKMIISRYIIMGVKRRLLDKGYGRHKRVRHCPCLSKSEGTTAAHTTGKYFFSLSHTHTLMYASSHTCSYTHSHTCALLS